MRSSPPVCRRWSRTESPTPFERTDVSFDKPHHRSSQCISGFVIANLSKTTGGSRLMRERMDRRRLTALDRPRQASEDVRQRLLPSLTVGGVNRAVGRSFVTGSIDRYRFHVQEFVDAVAATLLAETADAKAPERLVGGEVDRTIDAHFAGSDALRDHVGTPEILGVNVARKAIPAVVGDRDGFLIGIED